MCANSLKVWSTKFRDATLKKYSRNSQIKDLLPCPPSLYLIYGVQASEKEKEILFKIKEVSGKNFRFLSSANTEVLDCYHTYFVAIYFCSCYLEQCWMNCNSVESVGGVNLRLSLLFAWPDLQIRIHHCKWAFFHKYYAFWHKGLISTEPLLESSHNDTRHSL